MKEQRTKNQKNNKLKFIRTPFELLAHSLSEMKNKGCEINLSRKDNLQWGDKFVISRTFPFTKLELNSLNKDFNKWQKIIETAPHLFQKQKVVYLTNRFLNASVADWFYKNEPDKKTVFLKSMKDFNFIKNNAQKAIIFQEYKFNYARFFIEAIKYLETHGWKIRFDTEGSDQIYEEHPAVLLPVKTYKQFVLVLKEGKSIITCVEKNDKILVTSNEYPFQTSSDLVKICEKYFHFDAEKVEEIKVLRAPSLKAVHDIATKIEERMKCCFASSNLNDYYDIGLEKFDLARQTGISYEDFKIYFHRYGKGIDEITETAYRTMNQTRNPEAIWRIAERDYQDKYEWRQISE